MKKLIYAFLSLGFPFFLFAQGNLQKDIPQAKKGKYEVALPDYQDNDLRHASPVRTLPGENDRFKKYRARKKSGPVHRTVIGKTVYDLQTNNSVARRIQVNPDGTISAVWTMSRTQGPNFSDRGTGYNHFDGTSWGSIPTTRVEPDRCGWPNLGYYRSTSTNNNVEFLVTHLAKADGTSGGYYYSKNDGVGSGNWTSEEREPLTGPIWFRTAVDGHSNIHMIGTYSGDENSVVKNGIDRPTVYYQYDPNKDKFNYKDMMLPGYDDTRFVRGRADAYAIDAHDSIVAILFGAEFTDVTLWKSYDYGNTWNKIIVDSFPVPAFEFNKELDTTLVPDGNVSIVIDSNGTVHASWGTLFIWDDNPFDDNLSLLFNNALAYWNDKSLGKEKIDSTITYDTTYKDTVGYTMEVDGKIIDSLAFMFDTSWNYTYDTATDQVDSSAKSSMDLVLYEDPNKPFTATRALTVWPTYHRVYYDTSKDDTTSMAIPADSISVLDSYQVKMVTNVDSSYQYQYRNKYKEEVVAGFTLDRNNSNVIELGDNTLSLNYARYGNASIATQPNISLDENGNIFIAYSALIETNDPQFLSLDLENFRDIYVVYSTDNGKTWGDPQNISNEPFKESVYPSLARVVDDSLHIIFQEDVDPGSSVGGAQGNQNIENLNDIVYASVSRQDVMNDAVGPGRPLGVNDQSPQTFRTGKVYPNPFHGYAHVEIMLDKPSSLELTLVNMVGKTVEKKSFSGLMSGKQKVSIGDANLEPGVYFLRISTGDKTVTKKVAVQ